LENFKKMKNLLLILLLCILAANAIQGQTNIPDPTRETIKIAPDPMSAPENLDDVYHYYDANGQRFESKANRWDGDSWELFQRIYYSYDADGRLIETLTLQWDETNAGLINFRRVNDSYNNNGQLLSSKTYYWDNALNTWWLNFNTEYQYDGQGLNYFYSTQSFLQNGQQTGGHRDSIQYDPEGRRSRVVRQIYISNNWQYQQRLSYQYPGAGAENYQYFTESWDIGSNQWLSADRRTTVNQNSAEKAMVVEILISGVWTPTNRLMEYYNAIGQLQTLVYENRDLSTAVWDTTSILAYDFNNDYSFHQFRYSVWDAPTDIFYLWIVVDYDYAFYPVNTTVPALPVRVSLSPNPVTDFARINVENPEKKPVTYALFNAGGRLLRQWTSPLENNTLHMMEYPPGAYYLRVIQGESDMILPVIKN
jgi:hypothetical protein